MQRKSCKYDSTLSEEFYNQTADCDQQSIVQSLNYFHIAILIQKYINEFVYFLTKIPHLFPFSKKRKMHASSSACISLVNKFCYFTACKFLVNTLTELR